MQIIKNKKQHEKRKNKSKTARKNMPACISLNACWMVVTRGC